MSRIQLLPEEVASQVAAGEVVERPASVAKELVENSLDAKATRIEVGIRRGGIAGLKVIDNGSGMDRDDALLSLERHATSKIRTGGDLATVATMGFRGEALPSIASVSRFRLATREHHAVSGTEILVNGGKLETVRDSGEAPGTLIEVRSLFYNLPARRKFLRSENTEAGHVEHQLHLQAIGHPAVAFVFVRDDRTIFQLPGAASLGTRIHDLLGGGLMQDLLEVSESELGGVLVRGFVGKPGVGRSTRSQQITFVNGRPIESPTINHGLREGYHTALMKGQYPVTFLFIEMPHEGVDVNVHPAKREVRFREPSLIREAVARAVRLTVESSRPAWSSTFQQPASSVVPSDEAKTPGTAFSPATSTPRFETAALIPERDQTVLRRDWCSENSGPASSAPGSQPAARPEGKSAVPSMIPEIPAAVRPKAFRILGVLGKLYILMENASGLVLVDQHAAHERVLFEELRRRLDTVGIPGQRLLITPTIQLPPRDFDWVKSHLEDLSRMGISLDEFGPNTFKIEALPEYLIGEEPAQLMRDLIEELRSITSETTRVRLGEDMIATTVCRHAVKAHDFLRDAELIKLIEDLLACELPYCCPHGRPTMIQISYGELEKKFGRKV